MSKDIEYISKSKFDAIPKDYKTTVGDTIKYSREDKEMLRKKYKDLGYDETDPMILTGDSKAGTVLKPVKVKKTENEDDTIEPAENYYLIATGIDIGSVKRDGNKITGRGDIYYYKTEEDYENNEEDAMERFTFVYNVDTQEVEFGGSDYVSEIDEEEFLSNLNDNILPVITESTQSVGDLVGKIKETESKKVKSVQDYIQEIKSAKNEADLSRILKTLANDDDVADADFDKIIDEQVIPKVVDEFNVDVEELADKGISSYEYIMRKYVDNTKFVESIQSVGDLVGKIDKAIDDIKSKNGKVDFNVYELTSEIEEEIERTTDPDEKDILTTKLHDLNNLWSQYDKKEESNSVINEANLNPVFGDFLRRLDIAEEYLRSKGFSEEELQKLRDDTELGKSALLDKYDEIMSKEESKKIRTRSDDIDGEYADNVIEIYYDGCLYGSFTKQEYEENPDKCKKEVVDFILKSYIANNVSKEEINSKLVVMTEEERNKIDDLFYTDYNKYKETMKQSGLRKESKEIITESDDGPVYYNIMHGEDNKYTLLVKTSKRLKGKERDTDDAVLMQLIDALEDKELIDPDLAEDLEFGELKIERNSTANWLLEKGFTCYDLTKYKFDESKKVEGIDTPESMVDTTPETFTAHCDECLEDFEYTFDPLNEVSNDIEIYQKGKNYAYYAECPNCGNLVEVGPEELDLVVTNVDDISKDGFFMEIMDKHTARKTWLDVSVGNQGWQYEFNQTKFDFDNDKDIVISMFIQELEDYDDVIWKLIDEVIADEHIEDLEECATQAGAVNGGRVSLYGEKAKQLREKKANKVSQMSDIDIVIGLEEDELTLQDKEDWERVKTLAKGLAGSQGFYGRLLANMEAMEDDIDDESFPIIL